MIRKTIACLIIFASISILLVNQIIPHHHHNAKICYEEQNYCHEGKHDGEPLNDNNSKNDCALCGLFQAIIIPADQIQKSPLSSIVPLNDYNGHVAILYDDFTSDIESITCSVFNQLRLPPLIKVYHSSGTLRAPPLSV